MIDSQSKTERFLVILLHVCVGGLMYLDYPEEIKIATLVIFTLYLFAFGISCQQIINKPKPSTGRIFFYRKSFIGVDYYWIIPAQVLTIINWQQQNFLPIWVLAAYWLTVLSKGVLRQAFGDFYILLTENEIKINEGEEYLIKVDELSEVEVKPNKYKFINKDIEIAILLKRINSNQREAIKTSLDLLIERNNIKTVYNNV